MNVLFWMSGYFDRHMTSEHLLIAIIKSLIGQGNAVHIIQKSTGGELPPVPKELDSSLISSTGIPYTIQNKSNFVTRYLHDFKYIWDCKKVIKGDYDAVFIQSSPVIGLAVWAVKRTLGNNPIVTINVQDIFPYNAVFSGSVRKNSIVFSLLAALQRYGYKHADHVITISEDMKDTLIKDGTPIENVETIYNWSYQDNLYTNVDLTSIAHMFDENYFNVVYAGNIGVMQNVGILIEAAKLMKDDKKVWFHIIGDGVNKNVLENNAKEYGITNISFWPMQPSELAPAIYSAADVNVIPLVKDVYKTALPSKTATCLACQRPIIFAIGKDSKFGQKAMEEAGCPIVEADKPVELVEAIRRIQAGGRENKAGEFFLRYCGITENSKKYADIITKL